VPARADQESGDHAVFRGCTYRISIHNTGRKFAEQELLVEGKRFASKVVPPVEPGGEIRVMVKA